MLSAASFVWVPSQDIGTVQSMQKKVAEMENQLGQLEERIVASTTQSQQFAMADHFDKDTIIEKEVVLKERYQSLQVGRRRSSVCCVVCAGM